MAATRAEEVRLNGSSATVRKQSVAIGDNNSSAMGEAPMVWWVQDSDVAQCMICSREFGMTFRKHHCRGCGNIICEVWDHMIYLFDF